MDLICFFRVNLDMNEDILVTVICMTYNHVDYIHKSLDGFVSQETDFRFEVIVHDDASTDGTTGIIKEYQNKYSDIIVALFEDENQYSQGKSKDVKTKIAMLARGKYIAWCEGDDYWIDSKKLQKQADFLNANPDYSYCVSHIKFHDLNNNIDMLIPRDPRERDYSPDEIIRGGAIFQLSGVMMRTDIYRKMPDCFDAKGFGDIQIYIYGALTGKCHVLTDIMSHYNYGVVGSFTERHAQANSKSKIEHQTEYYKMLERVNAYYCYKYNDSFNYAVDRIKFSIAILNGDIGTAKQYKSFWKSYKQQRIRDGLAKCFPWLRIIKRKITYRLSALDE